ncbi:MAG: motility associated factor glycosyltransferase family protein, partial [Treponema sp.]|nr:motility associated factor glycosyltransferase family protein [Treponema sp.]
MLYSNTIPAKNNQIIPVFYDGRPMHSKYDPLREAENFVQNINKSDFFVVAGIGAGYHIKKISEKFPESVILAVENSNLELDFLRKNISEIKTIENQKNIYFSTLTDFPEKLKNLYVPAVYDKINLVEHKAWSTANSENYSRLVELFKNSIRDISSDFSTQAHFGKLWTRNILQNLKHINNEKKFNFPINKTALIVAA